MNSDQRQIPEPENGKLLRGACCLALMLLAPWFYWEQQKVKAVLCLCAVQALIEWQRHVESR